MDEKTLAEHRSDHRRTLREKVSNLAGSAKHHEFHADKAHRLCGGTVNSPPNPGVRDTHLPLPEEK